MVDVEGNSGLLLDIDVNNETETTNSQCSALSHTSFWPQKSVRKKKPTQVINRGNLSTCYRVVNGPLESISSDLALDTLAEGLVVSCVGGTQCISSLEGM
ncbi:hypothetical protein IGI04_023485 [Brassica rapa subsp. trilocularis]|uniref:Uncharacterized protein n=1 Tax=Brassica rapa subsp. trilocularis TaxID=1813537 RepID=A0ABQ7M4L4_BRACM|nr:hypothetical protein IGI04_023485 [Brassica rapa subsp. trilocularis]